MVLDFIASMVAVVQYDGSTECCGEYVMNMLVKTRWDVVFRVITVLYVCMILAEIVPVIKNGVPFNVINPAFGFAITAGMFFDDSVIEAVLMWVIEALAIFFEFLVYRVNARIYFETVWKLKQVSEELESLKLKRKRFAGEMMTLNGGTMHNSVHSGSPNGSIHSGSMHSGSMHNGSMHNGSMHGSRHATRMFGASTHGPRHGDPMHGPRHSGSMHGGSRHGDPTHGSRHIRDVEMGMNGPSQKRRGPSRHSYDVDNDDDDDDDDDDSLSGHSFGGDEDFYDEQTPSGRSLTASPSIRPRQGRVHMSRIPSGLNRARSRDALGSSNHSYGASTAVTGFTGIPGNRFRLPGEVKQNRLLRQRRVLREEKKAQEKDLHYHFIATILNVSLAVAALIFVVTISSTGGLCFYNGEMKPFSFDQLRLCDRCGNDKSEECQSCANESNGYEEHQCYYPYY